MKPYGKPHNEGPGMAAALYGRVPERLDRDAQRRGRDEVEEIVDDDDGEKDPGGPAGPVVRENA